MKVTKTQRRSKEKRDTICGWGGRVGSGQELPLAREDSDKPGVCHPSDRKLEKQQGDVSGTCPGTWKRTRKKRLRPDMGI